MQRYATNRLTATDTVALFSHTYTQFKSAFTVAKYKVIGNIAQLANRKAHICFYSVTMKDDIA